MVRQLEPKDLKINSCFGKKYPICNKIALKIIFVGFQAMSECKFSMILKRPGTFFQNMNLFLNLLVQAVLP
jgi:hypothetical protein